MLSHSRAAKSTAVQSANGFQLVETPASLLERLRAPDDSAAWERFVQLYSPVLFRWLTRQACPRDEIEDVMQEVFLTLAKVLQSFSYDRQKGFRRWLKTVAVNKWRDRLKRRRIPLIDDPNQAAQSMTKEADQFWEVDYRGYLARRALEIMQADFPGKSWKACWMIVVEDQTASEVARKLEMTIGAVHAAKFRVLNRLRHELAGLMD